MLKILFIGDINGKIGRLAVKKILPSLKNKLGADLVIANAENIAHGAGVTEATIKEVKEAGVDWFTNGDHAFDREKQIEVYDKQPVLRPANYSKDAPGKGFAVISAKGHNILLVNLIGRVFMSMNYECPFKKIDDILADSLLAKKIFSAIIIDMHAEATAEKVAFGHYVDGRASAVLGTHTHIMTADHKITKSGTAYITDVGMAGFADGCIGVEKEGIIDTFITQIKHPHKIPEKGQAVLNAVLLAINPKTKKTVKIAPIAKYVDIK